MFRYLEKLWKFLMLNFKTLGFFNIFPISFVILGNFRQDLETMGKTDNETLRKNARENIFKIFQCVQVLIYIV